MVLTAVVRVHLQKHIKPLAPNCGVPFFGLYGLARRGVVRCTCSPGGKSWKGCHLTIEIERVKEICKMKHIENPTIHDFDGAARKNGIAGCDGVPRHITIMFRYLVTFIVWIWFLPSIHG